MNETALLKTVPRHVVMVIPFDVLRDEMLVMLRGPNVRSAPNVWSFPSGMHDHGETMHECARRELYEEYSLRCGPLGQVGTVENVPGDGWHWVITLFVGLVNDVRAAVNREPDKHPRMEFPMVGEILMPRFYKKYAFNQAIGDYLQLNRGRIVNAMNEIALA